ncbi:hypothetical protein EHQ81_02440 [Leptospira selangorensis]|uniref:Uncharacterized protein n=1 Tax=Leptospira selangorensis TaxID=2484982 RepID=A0A5F2BXU5_9LEPT|nr:hypothetical protein EHQ81_02440 [Leptospira selangorensis]TGM16535.1 hypothetical protein EHQ82_16985 [Leptospira selangorensis]
MDLVSEFQLYEIAHTDRKQGKGRRVKPSLAQPAIFPFGWTKLSPSIYSPEVSKEFCFGASARFFSSFLDPIWNRTLSTSRGDGAR